MAATVYLRCISDNQVTMKLLIAKTKLAPVKSLTIPRLELCAALLVSKLANHVIEAISLRSCPLYLWSDSTVALAWIQSSPHSWQPFVSHRIAEIQRLNSHAQWQHIDGKINLADPATRGITCDELVILERWWNGPEFLNNNSEPFVNEQQSFDSSGNPERRKILHSVHVSVKYKWE